MSNEDTRIRHATPEDMDMLLHYASNFSKASVFSNRFPLDMEQTRFLITKCIHDPDFLALVFPGGVFLGGIMKPLWFKGRLASELAFWVEPEKRGKLNVFRILKEFEDWGTERGVTGYCFHLLGAETSDQFLQRKDYELFERSYLKLKD